MGLSARLILQFFRTRKRARARARVLFSFLGSGTLAKQAKEPRISGTGTGTGTFTASGDRGKGFRPRRLWDSASGVGFGFGFGRSAERLFPFEPTDQRAMKESIEVRRLRTTASLSRPWHDVVAARAAVRRLGLGRETHRRFTERGLLRDKVRSISVLLPGDRLNKGPPRRLPPKIRRRQRRLLVERNRACSRTRALKGNLPYFA